MIRVNVSMRGVDKVIETVENINIKKTDMDKVVKKVATDLQSNAKRDCPVDTGLLKSRITLKKVTNGYAVYVYDVYYDVFVHDGTRYMPPRPFLMGFNAQKAERDLTLAVRQLIDRGRG